MEFMNAINFLTKEHDKVRKVLAEIKKAQRYSTKQNKFKALCRELIIHENMEQKVWYPSFRNDKRLKKEVKHLVAEEKGAEKAITKCKGAKTEEAWKEKFAKFKKAVEHHAHEEEAILFPNVEEILTKKELDYLGKAMRKFKNKYTKKKH